MNNNCSPRFLGGAAAHIIRKTMAAAAMLIFSGVTYAQEKGQDKKEGINFPPIPSPTTQKTITPPVGNSAFLLGHGVGTPGYVKTLPNELSCKEANRAWKVIREI